MNIAARALLLLQTDTPDTGGGFPFWVILLLASAAFWLWLARKVKRTLDGMDIPDAAPLDQGKSSSDE